MNVSQRARRLVIVASVAVAAVALLGLWLHARHEAGPVPVHAQLTVQQVASGIGATRLADCGPAPMGGVTDSAVAWLPARNAYVGINVFPSAAVRGSWEKSSAKYGVSWIEHGDTWTVYRSVGQHPGC